MPLTAERAQEMLDETQGLYDDAINAAVERYPALIEQAAFYRGFQWGTATPAGWESQYDPDEAQEVLNHVRPTVRTAVADMLRNIPNPDVVAASSDTLAVARANASRRLLRSFLRNGVVAFDQIMRGELAAQIHGASWFKVVWDPNRGFRSNASMLDPESGQPMQDEFGAARYQAQAEGEIAVTFADIMSCLADPHARSEDEVRHVFHRKILPVGLLDDQFPLDAFGEETEGRWGIYRQGEGGQEARDLIDNDNRSLGVSPMMNQQASADANELAELVEFWEQPTNRYPNGRLIVFSNEVLIAASALPYEFPWVLRMGQNILPGGLYPDGVVRDIIPIQRTINLNASKRREWMDKILSPPLLNSNASGIDKALFSDMAGEIIDYNQGHQPQWMSVPDMPAGMFALEDQAISVLQTISTYSDISRGEPPQGYDSGRALAYLYEFQKGVHEPDVQMFRDVIARILTKCLKIARDYYDDGRLVRLLGEPNKWTKEAFKAEDYDFDAEVVVEAFSGQPNSRALRFGERIELFQLGAFEDTPAAKRLRASLDVDADDQNATAWEDAHRARAMSEETEMAGNPFAQIVVLEQDDHEIHIDVHGLFRISPRYFDLPPMQRQAFDDHVAQHETELSEQDQAAAISAQQAMGPTANAMGGPPPPKPPGMESPPDGGHSVGEPPLPQMEQMGQLSPEELVA